MVGPGIGFGQIEAAGVLGLAEIDAGVQFLEANQLRAMRVGLAHAGDGGVEISPAILAAGMLNHSDAQGIAHERQC